MKFSEALTVALLVWVPLAGWAAEAGPADPPSRFAAIRRPALAVKAPARAVLQAGVELADGRLVCVGERGLIALSDNGGETWRQAGAVPTSITLTAVTASPSGEVLAVGHGGVVLRSVDRGERWSLLSDGRDLATRALDSAKRMAPPAVAEAERAHRDAQQLLHDGPDKPLMGIAFQDARRGIVVGAYNLAFITEDGGLSWHSVMHRLQNPKALHLHAVAIQGSTWMIAGEQGMLFRSRDSGRTFERLNSPYAGSWFAVTPGEPGTWYLAGLRGHAHYSDDDGRTWTALEGGPPSAFVGAVRRGDGTVLLVNQNGRLFSAQGKRALRPVAKELTPPLNHVVALKNGDLVALGLSGAMKLEGAGL
jgi:photosystem II stability/assembly factor-like uncharacterized protein